jgi:TPR repeat protein
MKRAEVNDPVAIYQMGLMRHAEGDYDGALEYWTKAAELGDIRAHYLLSIMYGKGEGVEKDKKKGLYHLEQAAIGGDPYARYDLGCVEEENGRNDRAIKHWIIAANLGQDGSLDALKEGFKSGLVTKEDYAVALRGHQAAVDATKSPQRDEAEAALQALQNLDSSAFSRRLQKCVRIFFEGSRIG